MPLHTFPVIHHIIDFGYTTIHILGFDIGFPYLDFFGTRLDFVIFSGLISALAAFRWLR